MNRIKEWVTGQSQILHLESNNSDMTYGSTTEYDLITIHQEVERLKREVRTLLTALRITICLQIVGLSLIGATIFINYF